MIVHLKLTQTIFLILFSAMAYSQQNIVGIVRQENNEVLAYASVAIPYTEIGVLTDENGRYEMTIPAQYEKDSVLVSYVGFQSQSASIQGRDVIDFALRPRDASIEAVVVTPVNADTIMARAHRYFPENHFMENTHQKGFMKFKTWMDDSVIQVGEVSYALNAVKKEDELHHNTVALKSRMIIDSAAFKQINEVFNPKKSVITFDPVNFLGLIQNMSWKVEPEANRKSEIVYEYMGRDNYLGHEAYVIQHALFYKGRKMLTGQQLIDVATYATLSQSFETVAGTNYTRALPFVVRALLKLKGYNFDIDRVKVNRYYEPIDNNKFILKKGVTYYSGRISRKGQSIKGANQQTFYLNTPRADRVEGAEDKIKSTIVQQFDDTFFKSYYSLKTSSSTQENIQRIIRNNTGFSGSITSEKYTKRQDKKSKDEM